MHYFPFPVYSEKMDTPQCTPKVSDTYWCMTLGHSNWFVLLPFGLGFCRPASHLIPIFSQYTPLAEQGDFE